MIFFLLQENTNNHFFIDVGSRYTKVSKAVGMNQTTILTNLYSKRLTPTYISFKSPKKSTTISKNTYASDLIPEIGIDALKNLQYHPEQGSGSFFRYVDKINSNMEKMGIVNPSELFGIENVTASFIYFLLDQTIMQNDDISCRFIVPLSWGFPEYQQLQFIAETAGLTNISFVSDAAVAAFSYPYKQKPVLFIDVGASSTKAFLVQYSPGPTVYSYKISEKFSGNEMTLSLMNYFIDKHDFGSLALAERRRLFEVCEKIKYDLTISSNSTQHVENINGADHELKITRQEFESLLEPMLVKFMKIVLDAAHEQKIEVIELIGGASRVPIIQTKLKKIFRVDRIGHSMNADEAYVTGAPMALEFASIEATRSSYQDIPLIDNKQLGITGCVTVKNPDNVTVTYRRKKDKKTLHYKCNSKTACVSLSKIPLQLANCTLLDTPQKSRFVATLARIHGKRKAVAYERNELEMKLLKITQDSIVRSFFANILNEKEYKSVEKLAKEIENFLWKSNGHSVDADKLAQMNNDAEPYYKLATTVDDLLNIVEDMKIISSEKEAEKAEPILIESDQLVKDALSTKQTQDSLDSLLQKITKNVNTMKKLPAKKIIKRPTPFYVKAIIALRKFFSLLGADKFTPEL